MYNRQKNTKFLSKFFSINQNPIKKSSIDPESGINKSMETNNEPDNVDYQTVSQSHNSQMTKPEKTYKVGERLRKKLLMDQKRQK